MIKNINYKHKKEKIMKTRNVIFGLVFGVFAIVSCTKEEVKKETYDNAVYQEELVFINDVEEEDLVILGGTVVTSNGMTIDQNGIVYLLDNNSAIDMCIVSNGEYKFDNIENKKYGLEFDFESHSKKTINSVYPQPSMRVGTIY
jgi:hypothetical protein